MKKVKMSGKLTLAEQWGRIPVPKVGGSMKPAKGRGSYNRNSKHKKGWSDDKNLIIPFLLYDKYSLEGYNHIRRYYGRKTKHRDIPWGF